MLFHNKHNTKFLKDPNLYILKNIYVLYYNFSYLTQFFLNKKLIINILSNLCEHILINKMHFIIEILKNIVFFRVIGTH